MDDHDGIRLDKWLWAARFFKTRSLAAEAASGGKIVVNGERPKPSRIVRIGDRLHIRRGAYEWTVIVKGVSRLRGPASQTQTLYQETEESLRKRDAAIAQMRLERPVEFDSSGRPSKKGRRGDCSFHQARLVIRRNPSQRLAFPICNDRELTPSICEEV